MYQPQSITYKFAFLLAEINQGKIKIPQFQREFVWSKEDSAKLMDSIIKGYPIGTFILWKTKEQLRSIKNIGGIDLPDTPEGDFIQYVLDGQQRMTSLYASLEGLTIKRANGKEEDFSEIYVDLLAEEENDENVVITNIEGKENNTIIKLTELLNGGLSLARKFDERYHSKIEQYQQRIATYDFPTILINNSSIDIATEIFTRINVGGRTLSVFEIMVAKTFDTESGFDLAEKFDELITSLSQIDYDTLPNSTVLQTVAICLVNECGKHDILRLDKQQFIKIWDGVVDAIEKAAEYFRNYYRIPVSGLLPYNVLIIPFAYYFYKQKDKPMGEQQKYMEDYFWRAALSERFSSGQETKLAQDIKKIDEIISNKKPRYDFQVDVSPEAIMQNGSFSVGRSYIKSLLCILAYERPLSFSDNSVININNNWLKQANSKNYHHFFPRAYLKKQGEEEFRINHILNITIVDDFLNKRQIKAKPPAQYMKEFSTYNSEIETTMKKHLIQDLDEFGVWENDYDKFFKARAKAFSEKLKNKLILENPENIETNQDDISEAPENLRNLEEEFAEKMNDIFIKANIETGYKPTRFLQMLNERGAIATAKTLIGSPGSTEGFAKLWELGRLDLSVEALVVQERFKPLFSEEEIEGCQRVLADCGYQS